MLQQGRDNFESRAERIEWIDEAKGIGIVLVMLGHCCLHWKFCFWFYAFHMPLFCQDILFQVRENLRII